MHNVERQNKFLIWFVAGMLLASSVAVAMSARAYAQSAATINGAGATFPFPLIDTWRIEYQKVKQNVNINYQSIGSGGGIKQFTAKTVDFGASDASLQEAERNALPGPAVHIPETIGSVVVTYNIPGFDKNGLKLTGPVIADIFQGKIKKWDDPAIKQMNPDVPIPSQDIVVVHRSDGSGTTFVWTSYLSAASSSWKDTIGAGKSVQWPTGIGAPGNDGVSNTVKSTFYAIGYVELTYALTTNMHYASIQNKAGNFIEPSLDSTSAAIAASSSTLPKGDQSWQNVTMINAAGDKSYPIASLTYLLLYKDLSTNIDSLDKAKALVDFVSWAITDGQQFAPKLSYVPLPDSIVKVDQETLASLTYKGQSISTSTQPKPNPQEQSFTASSTLDGKNYSITGKSTAGVKATSFTINPSTKSVKVQIQGQGEVELTLPKNMISGITMVMVGGQQITPTKTETADSTAIKFTVPQNTDSVDIVGTTVVPEFGTIAALLMAISIAAIIGYVRFARTNSSLIGGRF